MNTTELWENYYITCFHHVYTNATQYPPDGFVRLSQNRKGYCCHNIDIDYWSDPYGVTQPSRETLQSYNLTDVQTTQTNYKKSITTPEITKEPLFSANDFCYFKNGERVSLKVQCFSTNVTLTGSIFIGTIPHHPEEDIEFPIIVNTTPTVSTVGIVFINTLGEITVYGDINKNPATEFIGWKTTFITYFLC